jgi:hypothetical protein
LPLSVTFGDFAPLWAPQGKAPNAFSKPGLFNPWGFAVEALSQDACFVEAWPPVIFAPAALPHGSPLSCLGYQTWTLLASTILVGPFMQEWPKAFVGTLCYARMTLDRISATVTYVICCEEHLWNVIVLQIIHFHSCCIKNEEGSLFNKTKDKLTV